MNNLKSPKFSKKIKFLRQLHNLTQSELAAKLNLSQQVFSNIENGKHKISEKILNDILSFFKLSYSDFLNIEEDLIDFSIKRNSVNENEISTKIEDAINNMIKININLYEKLILEKDKRIELLEVMVELKNK